MSEAKRLFWMDSETVIQFHPAADEYVNYDPFVLHLWKLFGHSATLPPMELIAPRRSKVSGKI